MKKTGLLLFSSILGTTLLFGGSDGVQVVAMAEKSNMGYAPGDIATFKDSGAVIPNPVIVNESRKIITLEAVGMGVSPAKTISKAQSIAMAKRAAIIDGYRQLGEKMHGIKIDGKETVRDMVLQDSTIKTKLLSIVKNAAVVETTFEDGLCQVKMELRLDGTRWYGLLTGTNF